VQSQYFDSPIAGAAEITAVATFETIEPEVATANKSHSDLWLAGAVRVIFMSYFIPLPGLDDAGLGKAWDGLDVVSKIVIQNGNFHIAAPMEFRFVKGGNSALSGTFTQDPEHTWFVNLDLIGFVEAGQIPSDYPAKLLQFFADVERQWVEMGGLPHNGKMYGFYDPTDAPGTYSKTGPFNPNFLAKLRGLRGARLEAFNAYRKGLDPNGLFYNEFLRNSLEP
jgi:FAD/FMN-containing dehydrogenase